MDDFGGDRTILLRAQGSSGRVLCASRGRLSLDVLAARQGAKRTCGGRYVECPCLLAVSKVLNHHKMCAILTVFCCMCRELTVWQSVEWGAFRANAEERHCEVLWPSDDQKGRDGIASPKEKTQGEGR